MPAEPHSSGQGHALTEVDVVRHIDPAEEVASLANHCGPDAAMVDDDMVAQHGVGADDDLVVVQVAIPRVVLAHRGDLRGAPYVRTGADADVVTNTGRSDEHGERADRRRRPRARHPGR